MRAISQCTCLEDTMTEHEAPDPQFDAMTARLLRREALRRAANELNTTSDAGLEAVLARISAEVTAESAEEKASAVSQSVPGPAAGSQAAG
jgi:phage shock protein A